MPLNPDLYKPFTEITSLQQFIEHEEEMERKEWERESEKPKDDEGW